MKTNKEHEAKREEFSRLCDEAVEQHKEKTTTKKENNMFDRNIINLVLVNLVMLMVLSFASNVNAGAVIDRTWTDKYGYAYALVSYENDSNNTYKTIRIKCTAYDYSGQKINFNTRSFFQHEYGYMAPGFSESVKVPIKLHGLKVNNISCTCRQTIK